jgi:phosphohistidine swiveling domain-containing protein
MILSCEASPRSASAREVGGKAWNLLRLRGHGFPVPRFWVVPRGSFDEVVESCGETISRALSDPRSAAAAAGLIGEAISGCRVPPALAAELMEALPQGPLFAVRSSAVGEDSRQHSFAGVLESVLNVPRCDVAEALGRVWASAFSPRALLYRQRKGLTLEQTATAVIVQEMVQAARAGVLFTRDPADGARRFVVSAGLGLGQGVVSDAVETDTYRIGWEDGLVSSEVRMKRSRVVLAEPRRGGTREEPVSFRHGSRPALRSRQVRQLRDLGRDVERALGGPQDIEWAFDAEGRLFVLQARPIVNGARRPIESRRIWDNANIVESYPGLTLPLTFSFARRSYRRTFSHVARSFLAFGGARPSADVYDDLIGLIDGRVYYNLLAWYEMFSYLPGSDRYRESWDRLIGVAGHSAPPPSPGADLTRAGTLATSLAVLLRVESLRPRFFERFDALRARFRDAGSREETAEEVLATFRLIEEEAGDFWHLTIQNDFCALKYHQWLATLLDRWSPSRDPGRLNALLSGPEGVESVAPVRSLLSLAEVVRADPSCLELFGGGGGDRAIWAAVDGDMRWHALREAFQRHLREFGDRSVGELKLETVTFEEDPARLVGLVKHYLSLGLSAAELERQRAGPLAIAEELRRHAVPDVIKSAAFRFVLARARAAVRTREDMRLARTRLFGMVRRLFRRLGQLLHEQGLLDATSDVHYLTVEELLDLVRGTGVVGEPRALVALRKAEYARYASAPAPARLETVGIPCANSRPAPEAVSGLQTVLQGTGCSAGVATGRARVVHDPEGAMAARDCVLVAPSTDPGWVFLMMSAAGIVVERGSVLSHTAIIGRELGIPTVVGAAGATKLIPEGAALRIDGGTGDVRWA